MTAVQLDDSRAAYYVADEVVVDANDPDLVREYVNLGGEVVHDGSDPELPREFREPAWEGTSRWTRPGFPAA